MNNNQNRRSRMTPEERARYEAFVKQKRAEQERLAAQKKSREKAEKKKRRRENARIFKGRLLVFVIVLLLLALIAFVLLMVHFHRTPDSPESIGELTYYYGGKEVRSAPPDECAAAGGIYICFNDLSDYLGMAESGSAEKMKFILPDDASGAQSAAGSGKEEYVIFYSDAEKVLINGQEVTLNIPNVIHGDEIWVSTAFVEKYMNGLSIEYSDRQSSVSVARVKDEDKSTDTDTVYYDVSFKLKSSSPEDPITEDPLVGEVIFDSDGDYDLNFTADLAEYEDYMNPDGQLRDAFLELVNGEKLLDSSDEPDDLVDFKYTSASKPTQQLRLYACKALEALYEEMHALEYYDMSVYSGYVSYAYQKSQFEQYVGNEMAVDPSLTREQAEKTVSAYYALPGTSEHQTGLCVDTDTMGAYTTDFQYTEEYAWLVNNAWKFGYILRYPSGKESVTGNSFEPWHLRYVGRYHALKIHESGLCLEEYLKQIKK